MRKSNLCCLSQRSPPKRLHCHRPRLARLHEYTRREDTPTAQNTPPRVLSLRTSIFAVRTIIGSFEHAATGSPRLEPRVHHARGRQFDIIAMDATSLFESCRPPTTQRPSLVDRSIAANPFSRHNARQRTGEVEIVEVDAPPRGANVSEWTNPSGPLQSGQYSRPDGGLRAPNERHKRLRKSHKDSALHHFHRSPPMRRGNLPKTANLGATLQISCQFRIRALENAYPRAVLSLTRPRHHVE